MPEDPQQQPDDGGRQQMATAMATLWEKFRGTALDRVTAIEEAAVAQLEGVLDAETRRHAEREAHKLAGAAGTFGFAEGSRLSRDVEYLLQGSAPLGREETLRLSELVVALRTEMEQPVAVPAEGEAASDAPRPLLLIADADAEFAQRLELEAEGRGLAVRRAGSIQEAQQVLAREEPAAMLLDPSFDGGREAGMELLAQATVRNPARPVLVATSADRFAERVEAARFGARAFLQKPLSPAAVVDAVLKALEQSSVSGYRILAVDDDVQVLGALRSLLTPRGVDLTTLDDPLRFWEVLESVQPELVILDVDMPELGGVELCRVVRNEARWSMLPVLFLTARTDASTVHRIFEAGADDYVAKPFVGPELVARIVNRLERTRLFHIAASTDGLTGVANRRKAEESLDHLLRLAKRQKQSLTVAMVDLDHFKQINDRLGHATGDEVLRRVARHLRRAVRTEDVVGRWGGEEFVVGMYGMGGEGGVARLTEVLENVRRDVVAADRGGSPITFSAGVATFPGDGGELGALLAAADETLYEAKQQGRDRVLSAGPDRGAARQEVVQDVVLVEDDEIVGEVLQHALETQGLTVTWFTTGEEAAESLCGPDAPLRARVIVLDVDLPGRDGLSVLRDLARTEVTRRSHVIVLTARATEPEVLSALEMGAADHVAKPFSVPVVLQRIRSALRT